jgi:Tfp pilus assembly protein PilN
MYATLNISNRSIKVLSVKGRQVKKWGNLALASGLARDGQILQPKAVGEAIAALFKSTGLAKERVITSLSGLSFTYRFLKLPKVKPAILDEAILRAVRKEISLPLEELYLSWQALPGQREERSYFILGVPKNAVDALEETLKIAGVEPYLIDLQPLALARAANRRDAIIVSMEPDCFDIIFITEGIPRVIHTISPRSEGATLEDNVKRLADELTKTTAFYQDRNPQSPLSPTTPLLLTGDLALELPASGLLQAETDHPIESLTPLLDCPQELPVASYTANIGLSLKKFSSKVSAGRDGGYHDININILSGKYRKIRAKPLSKILWISAALIAAAIIGLFPLYQARSQAIIDNARQQTELSNISREYNLASLVAEENAQIEEDIQKINDDTAALKAANQRITGTRGGVTRDLQYVTEALPPLTDFTSIEIINKQIMIHGETDSVFTVIDYATALEGNGIYPEVRITELDETISILGEGSITEEEPSTINRITFGIVINKQK